MTWTWNCGWGKAAHVEHWASSSNRRWLWQRKWLCRRENFPRCAPHAIHSHSFGDLLFVDRPKSVISNMIEHSSSITFLIELVVPYGTKSDLCSFLVHAQRTQCTTQFEKPQVQVMLSMCSIFIDCCSQPNSRWKVPRNITNKTIAANDFSLFFSFFGDVMRMWYDNIS